MEGAKTYVPDSAGAWRKATVVSALGGGRYRVQLDPWEEAGGAVGQAKAETVEVDASQLEGGALPFQNANMPENGFPNMTTLDHLHEPALLHNLRVRFFSCCPYTYTADIVIAVNPYRWIPELYTEDNRKEYLVFDRSKLAPHVYSTSSSAYSGLQESSQDQAILVSGESGAGKTETVKILMAHLALMASSDDASHIERIVESNPLLESFGNAQTVRNDNSSRFGKFIQLELCSSCKLLGSRCLTYLLEKSRVVSQDAGERNYHIFYQMLAVDAETRAGFGLGGPSHTRSEMRFTRLGKSPVDTIEGKTDAERFHSTTAALALVGVAGELLAQLLRAISSVLLLGQIEFKSTSQDEAAAYDEASKADAAAAAAVLQVDADSLQGALTKRTIKARNEKFVKALSSQDALATRDALAKELYARVFDWLVGKICEATSAAAAKKFIGLLDIFGFESFAINRFEQLCINYANEKLQQKFTHDVFKAVQQEYSDEGIPWDRIEFKDNAHVLSLIESKMGIIAMLNEEGVRPKGSDENFVSKLSTVHKAEAAFSTPRVGAQKELQFTVSHYAGPVTYTTTGWLERNKDTISDDVIGLLQSSGNPVIAGIFTDAGPADGAADGKAKTDKTTVATKFKNSLAQLMETVGRTNTQYVRCIKPNKLKSSTAVDNEMVIDQLRCAGVIEAIRISRAGFPARMPLKEFSIRFRVLVRGKADNIRFARGIAVSSSSIGPGRDQASQCEQLMAALAPGEKRYEIGRTRVYFKSGVLERLEERRALLLQAAATELGRRLRGQRQRRRYDSARRAALRLQTMRRMRRERDTYLATRGAIVTVQAWRRGLWARRRVAGLRRERCATRIQAFQRRRLAIAVLARARKAAVCLQAAARRKACRRQYLLDLVEHREQAKLENQVRALRAKLEAQEKASRERSQSVSISSEPPEEMLEALQALAAENAKLRVELERTKTDNAKLRKENQRLREGQSTRSDWLASIIRTKQHKSSQLSRQVSSLTHSVAGSDVAGIEDLTVSAPVVARTSSMCIKLYEPLSSFWEDAPCNLLLQMRSGLEVHVKIGPNLLKVEENNKHLMWQRWMDCSQGYRQSMEFIMERGPGKRSISKRSLGSGMDMDLPLGMPIDDGSIGPAFTLKSAFTGKYIVAGGMLNRYCMQVTGERREDAAVFEFAPLSPQGSAAAALEADSADLHAAALRLVGENTVLGLRQDGYVSTVAEGDPAAIAEGLTAASIEYLVPCISYELIVPDKRIGISVCKDIPLRVGAFSSIAESGQPYEPGVAELSGRVHIGDVITRVNGQDITGLPRPDVLEMIASTRPVSLVLSVTTEPGEA